MRIQICKRCRMRFALPPEATSRRVLCDACRGQRCVDCGKQGSQRYVMGRCRRCHRDTLPRVNDEGPVIEPTRLPMPCRAAPGTPEKIRILAERYAGGFFLWNSKDSGLEDE